MSIFRVLPRSFYEPSADIVACQLLGHWLVRNFPGGPCGGPIVEAEAYLTDDPACHSFPGPTPRNRAMFGDPGHSYVYFIYGCHFCINAVCRPAGVGEAVLIRALQPAFGEHILREHRVVANARNLTNGPAKLCQAMKIDRQLDGLDLCNSDSPLLIAQNPDHASFIRTRGPILTSPRIGITRAASAPLRFCLAGSAYVSRQKAVGADVTA